MSVRMVVFDMAGTTIKDADNVHHALMDAMQHFGYTVSREEANAVMGYPKPDAIRQLLDWKEPVRSKITEPFVQEIHEVFVQRMIHFYATEPGISGTAGAEDTFKALHEKGIRVALDTGFSKDITDTILQRLGWIEAGLVDDVVSSDEVLGGRPHPFMIHKLMKNAGIDDPLEVAKVGDTVSDLLEGKNAGTRYVIGIASGAFTREELRGIFIPTSSII